MEKGGEGGMRGEGEKEGEVLTTSTVAVNKKFTFRIHTTIVLRSVPFLRNLPVLRFLSQQLSPSRVSGQVRRPLSQVTSKLQTRDKRQRIVKAFQ